ncbi:hypothetical protein FB451DRAFT_1251850, partial [Mycena latifolia]
MRSVLLLIRSLCYPTRSRGDGCAGAFACRMASRRGGNTQNTECSLQKHPGCSSPCTNASCGFQAGWWSEMSARIVSTPAVHYLGAGLVACGDGLPEEARMISGRQRRPQP